MWEYHDGHILKSSYPLERHTEEFIVKMTMSGIYTLKFNVIVKIKIIKDESL